MTSTSSNRLQYLMPEHDHKTNFPKSLQLDRYQKCRADNSTSKLLLNLSQTQTNCTNCHSSGPYNFLPQLFSFFYSFFADRYSASPRMI